MYEFTVTYIWLICMVNVGKYASPMDDMGRFQFRDLEIWSHDLTKRRSEWLPPVLAIQKLLKPLNIPLQ